MRLLPPTCFLLLLLGPDLPLLARESEAVGVGFHARPLHPPGHELVHHLPIRRRFLRGEVLVDRLLLSTYLNFDFGFLKVTFVLTRIQCLQHLVIVAEWWSARIPKLLFSLLLADPRKAGTWLGLVDVDSGQGEVLSGVRGLIPKHRKVERLGSGGSH